MSGTSIDGLRAQLHRIAALRDGLGAWAEAVYHLAVCTRLVETARVLGSDVSVSEVALARAWRAVEGGNLELPAEIAATVADTIRIDPSSARDLFADDGIGAFAECLADLSNFDPTETVLSMLDGILHAVLDLEPGPAATEVVTSHPVWNAECNRQIEDIEALQRVDAVAVAPVLRVRSTGVPIVPREILDQLEP